MSVQEERYASWTSTDDWTETTIYLAQTQDTCAYSWLALCGCGCGVTPSYDLSQVSRIIQTIVELVTIYSVCRFIDFMMWHQDTHSLFPYKNMYGLLNAVLFSNGICKTKWISFSWTEFKFIYFSWKM